MFFWTPGQGRDLDTARTMVVNTLVVLEIFYLFSVRYLHMTSFTWTGLRGTPAVLLEFEKRLARGRFPDE